MDFYQNSMDEPNNDFGIANEIDEVNKQWDCNYMVPGVFMNSVTSFVGAKISLHICGCWNCIANFCFQFQFRSSELGYDLRNILEIIIQNFAIL